jgi:hypothetical protein
LPLLVGIRGVGWDGGEGRLSSHEQNKNMINVMASRKIFMMAPE